MGSATVTVRRARDSAEFRTFGALLVEYNDNLPPELRHDLAMELPQLERRYGEPNAAFYALVGDEPAGCVALAELDAATTIVKRLYVQPAHRGRGIARGLVGEALAFARERGYRRVVLDTDRDLLPAAYELYRALGFTECAPYGPVDHACPTFMELPLT